MIVISRCGYESRHKIKLDILRKTGVPNYLLLLVKSEAFFEIDGQIIETKPNMAILFDKNTYTHYGAIQNYYNDDWIHFDFINEKSLLESLQIPFNKPLYIPCISHLSDYVRLLVQESLAESKHKEQILDSLMRTLLYNLDSQVNLSPSASNNHKHYPVMNELRTRIHSNPSKKWTVDIMADSVHMSPSYFQHLYKELFGISCVQDVIKARLDYAKFNLNISDMSIQALSEFCGYENELHFMRQFKKFEGMTPSQYRQFFKENR
jgi:AraC family transcriptional regulator of arabinose operon